MRIYLILITVFLVMLAGARATNPPGVQAINNTIAAPDGFGANVGFSTSMRLDSSGKPVVAYYDATNKNLKVLHCGNSSCTSGNSIAVPDSAGDVGGSPSLALNGSGWPVISYLESIPGNSNLKVLRCGNANCTASNTITTPDSQGDVGALSSLVLDAVEKPVVSYYDDTGGLAILHCGNATCSSGNSITAPTDPPGPAGPPTISYYAPSSIRLTNGKPLVAYIEGAFGGDLKLLHCDDVNCAGDESANISTLVTGAIVDHASLTLDASDRPVIAYYSGGDLKVVHCNDTNCVGGDETFTTPDPGGADVGNYSSIVFDYSAGKPVVSYHDATNGDLKVLRCDDANCAGDESLNIVVPDPVGETGYYTSIRLSSLSYPLVSYYDETDGDLLILRCGDTSCAPP